MNRKVSTNLFGFSGSGDPKKPQGPNLNLNIHNIKESGSFGHSKVDSPRSFESTTPRNLNPSSSPQIQPQPQYRTSFVEEENPFCTADPEPSQFKEAPRKNYKTVSVASLGKGDLSGWLTKQGGRYKTWKRRWFILTADAIYYFKTQKDRAAQGVIRLSHRSWTTIENGKKGYRFQIVTDARVYYFKAETEKNLQEWVTVVSSRIKEIQEAHPPGSRLSRSNSQSQTSVSETSESEYSPTEDQPQPSIFRKASNRNLVSPRTKTNFSINISPSSSLSPREFQPLPSPSVGLSARTSQNSTQSNQEGAQDGPGHIYPLNTVASLTSSSSHSSCPPPSTSVVRVPPTPAHASYPPILSYTPTSPRPSMSSPQSTTSTPQPKPKQNTSSRNLSVNNPRTGLPVPLKQDEFCLLVHYGAAVPAKLIIIAHTLEQLISTIDTKLKIGLPFEISILDPDFEQYVIVTSLEDVPQKGTIKLVYY